MVALGDSHDFVDQRRQDCLNSGRRGGTEHRQGSFASPWLCLLQRGSQVRPEARRVIVPFVQREPGDGPPAAGGPLAQQRGLAKAGRGGDEREFAVQARVQPLDQARTRDQLGPDGGDIQFGGKQRHGHLFFPGYGWRRFAREPGDSDSTILSRLIQTRNAGNASGCSTRVQDRFALLPLAIQHYAPPAGNSMMNVVP